MNQPVPPRPRGRTLAAVLALGRDPLETTMRWFREHGDVVKLNAPGSPVWLLNNPAHIHQVLVRDHGKFRKDKFTRDLRDMMGNGLVTSDGDFWRRHRRLSQPAFHGEAIRSYGEQMVGLTASHLARWGDRIEIDVHAELMELTLAIAASTLFGADVSHEAGLVGRAIEAYMDAYLGLLGSGIRVPAFIPTPRNLKRRWAVRELHGVVERIVAEHRSREPDPRTLLGMLLATSDESGGLSDTQLRDEAITLLAAGHETTAVALTLTMYLLSQHPDAEETLKFELDQVLGDRNPEVADVADLKWTRAVIREAMRLYPPVWAIGREAMVPVQVGDYMMQPGDSVWMSQWTIHRDERWFADPLAWRPERWLDGQLDKGLPKCAYFPFGAGPRTCIGKRFAELEAVLVLATIARRYSLRLVPGQTLDLVPSVTLRPRDGLRMTATARKGKRLLVA